MTSTPTWPTGPCHSARAAGTTSCGGWAATSPCGCPGRRRVGRRPAAQGARLAARARPAPAAAGPRPAAPGRALRAVPAAVDRHHLGPGRARRPRPRDHAARRRPTPWPPSCRLCTSPPRPTAPPAGRQGRTAGRAHGRTSLAGLAAGRRSGADSRTLTPSARSGTTRSPRPPGKARPLWLHGDLHPANVLTADGAFCGVIDFGDMCAGDPACDLAACWILLPDGFVDRLPRGLPAGPGCRDLAPRPRLGGAAGPSAGILIGDAGDHGRPGGKPTWGPPAHAALRRLTATVLGKAGSDQSKTG